MHHAEAKEMRPALQAVRRLRAAVRLAAEMGENLERGEVLLGRVPAEAVG